jgi:hypothetical protein
MHTLKVLVFINKTKSFEVFLLEKYVCAKPKSKTKKKPLKMEKAIKTLT